MAKKHITTHVQPDLKDIQFLLDSDSGYDEEQETMHRLLEHVFAGAHHHMQTAMQLTQLVFEKTSPQNITAEQIFKTYREAVKTVAESSPLPYLLELMGPGE